MPRFLVYAPDYPNYLEKRLAVRKEHLERGAKDDFVLYAGPITPKEGDSARTLPSHLAADTPNIAGSFSVWQMDNLEKVWERIKEDVYWRAGVWDKEKLVVEELLG
ncbi:hypothetical protein IAT40_002990 [Kwoniella sp. CBS 6097]